ncbi:hypothetical protein JTE90_004330 [Oedothorax gibbosus]|uniref:Uncharacterized protein n=1 Tax=Oedothorax gibbosus TaxID=931172 RepID=A0AAV6VM06_9ARAC|nr:hypothetical protein JTE90_004330 [Oedothorax gibbosus]
MGVNKNMIWNESRVVLHRCCVSLLVGILQEKGREWFFFIVCPLLLDAQRNIWFEKCPWGWLSVGGLFERLRDSVLERWGGSSISRGGSYLETVPRLTEGRIRVVVFVRGGVPYCFLLDG